MKSLLLFLSAVVIAAAEPPAFKGVYFVAPPPAAPSPPRVDLEKATDDIMEQLKQIDGADSGAYHVYLPDGRLQKVSYTTAPLPGSAETTNEQFSQYRHHKPAVPAFSFQNNQQVNHQFVTGSNQQNSQSNQVSSRLETTAQVPASYVASVSYTDVEPITGPIYAHNEQPLTRILRYAPAFA